jgi:hypothetical protein
MSRNLVVFEWADAGVTLVGDVVQVIGELGGRAAKGHVQEVGFQVGVFVAANLDADLPLAVTISDHA